MGGLPHDIQIRGTSHGETHSGLPCGSGRHRRGGGCFCADRPGDDREQDRHQGENVRYGVRTGAEREILRLLRCRRKQEDLLERQSDAHRLRLQHHGQFHHLQCLASRFGPGLRLVLPAGLHHGRPERRSDLRTQHAFALVAIRQELQHCSGLRRIQLQQRGIAAFRRRYYAGGCSASPCN